MEQMTIDDIECEDEVLDLAFHQMRDVVAAVGDFIYLCSILSSPYLSM